MPVASFYRKKPVVIQAVEFKTNNDDGKCITEIIEWISHEGGRCRTDSTNIWIETLEGDMRAEVGDFIIKGVKGEFYPCKPDIFDRTYDPA